MDTQHDLLSLATQHAVRNGWKLCEIVGGYSLCQKSYDEWCVHTICVESLEHGHYFSSLKNAKTYALSQFFYQDACAASVAKINCTIVFFCVDSEQLCITWMEDHQEFEVKIIFDEIEEIVHHGIGSWSVTQGGKTKRIDFFVLTPCGVAL